MLVGVIVGVTLGVTVLVKEIVGVRLSVGVLLGVFGGVSSGGKQIVSTNVIQGNAVSKYPFSYQMVKDSPGLICFSSIKTSSPQYR